MSHSSAASNLTRGLTLVPTAAIVVAVVIGTGIFVKTRVMTCNVGEPGLVLAVYAYYNRRLPPDDPANWLGETADLVLGAVARDGALV